MKVKQIGNIEEGLKTTIIMHNLCLIALNKEPILYALICLEWCRAFLLNKLESPSYKDALFQVKIGPVVLKKRIFKFR